jgi:3-methyladenine DNA glycosylase AlkD
MTLEEAMDALRSAGSDQTRRMYRKHAWYTQIQTFGVSTADLRKLKKTIKADQNLARELWSTNVLDAQWLATMVADPKQFTSNELDAWVADIRFHMLADVFVRNVIVNTPFVREKAEAWIASDNEFTAQAGWDLVAALAMDPKCGLPDSYFENRLETIERDVNSARKRARYAMNGALIAIGSRSNGLRRLAEAAVKRIGPVDVDHGDTGCKTPEPISYIKKVWDRKKPKTATGSDAR